MDKTPKGKSLKYVKSIDNTVSPVGRSGSCSTSTPIKGSKKPRIWENDISSQDSSDVDVTWDWNSPKNIKPKSSQIIKREVRKSPVVNLKKTSQVNHTKNFEKLREELQALRKEIAKEDNDCVPLSPVDEQTFREESANECSDINSFIEQQYCHIENEVTESFRTETALLGRGVKNVEADLLDDSCDEQLFLCSQMIEEKLIEQNNSKVKNQAIIKTNLQENIYHDQTLTEVLGKSRVEEFRRVLPESKISSHGMDILINPQFKTADDSFDAVLKEFEDEDIELLTQTSSINNFVPIKKIAVSPSLSSSFKRTFSDQHVQYVSNNNRGVKSNKFQLHRTQSFESSITTTEELPKQVIEEMERKRKEALAKLKDKKEKHLPTTTTDLYSNISPMKCSPDEIEQKRLQAKAIREAKQREIIERNRLEALKRLEINRLKRSEKVKNSLAKKL